MVNYRKFCVSDELFSGFETDIDLDEVNSLNEIVNAVLGRLSLIFNNNNLDILLKKLSAIKFHIHDYTFEDILLSEPSIKFYICGHC